MLEKKGRRLNGELAEQGLKTMVDCRLTERILAAAEFESASVEDIETVISSRSN